MTSERFLDPRRDSIVPRRLTLRICFLRQGYALCSLAFLGLTACHILFVPDSSCLLTLSC